MHPAGIFLLVFQLVFGISGRLERRLKIFVGVVFFKFTSSSLKINVNFQHAMTSFVRGFNKEKILNRLRVMKEREIRYDIHIKSFTVA